MAPRRPENTGIAKGRRLEVKKGKKKSDKKGKSTTRERGHEQASREKIITLTKRFGGVPFKSLEKSSSLVWGGGFLSKCKKEKKGEHLGENDDGKRNQPTKKKNAIFGHGHRSACCHQGGFTWKIILKKKKTEGRKKREGGWDLNADIQGIERGE